MTVYFSGLVQTFQLEIVALNYKNFLYEIKKKLKNSYKQMQGICFDKCHPFYLYVFRHFDKSIA
jgi:hypothetical protein